MRLYKVVFKLCFDGIEEEKTRYLVTPETDPHTVESIAKGKLQAKAGPGYTIEIVSVELNHDDTTDTDID